VDLVLGFEKLSIVNLRNFKTLNEKAK